jgi:hypothetical protein
MRSAANFRYRPEADIDCATTLLTETRWFLPRMLTSPRMGKFTTVIFSGVGVTACLLFFAHVQAATVVVSGTDSLTISDATVVDLQSYDDSTVSVVSGGATDRIQAANRSTITLDTNGEIGQLLTLGDSTFSATGGTIGYLKLVNESVAYLRGGSIGDVERRDMSELHVYGTEFLWTRPSPTGLWMLNGFWADGSSFSFGVYDGGDSTLEDPSYAGGAPPEFLPPEPIFIFPNTPTPSTGIFLHTVPVPPAVWLFGSALGILGWMKRRSA